MGETMSIREFVDTHFHHFNSGEVKKSAQSLTKFLDEGGKIFLTLAGAMSTARIGKILAKMINKGYIAGISCTGANLEEDIFLLVANSHYQTVDNWRDLSSFDDSELLAKKLNRVTDVCIPEDEAIRVIEKYMFPLWQQYSNADQSALPHEFFYQIVLDNDLPIDGNLEDSWVFAAANQKIPLFVPGWEDSTMGNIFASHVLQSEINPHTVKGGISYMTELANWYGSQSKPLAFFQVGGGIAGDFPICVVPMLNQDMEQNVPLWSWFCQISESRPSFGGYSGAPPNEKITWGKLSAETPKFVIESDATVVLPIIFGYVLDI